MPRSNEDETALAAYTKTPPRNISIDPKSARTVVHEVRAHHRGPHPSDSSDDGFLQVPRAHATPQYTGNSGDQKFGILPQRSVTQRRGRSATEGGRRPRPLSDADTDTESDSDGYLSPRQARRRRRSSQSRSDHQSRSPMPRPPHGGRRMSNELTRYDNRRELAPRPRDRTPSYRDDHSDSEDSYDSEDHERKKQIARNKKLLYTGLATVTTVAACNNIYQNTKGFHARRNAWKEASSKGELDDKIERSKLRRNHLMMNALGVVVVGIGVNNFRIGWQRREEKRKAHEEAENLAVEKAELRRERESRRRAYSVEEPQRRRAYSVEGR